ncbi:MAG: MFS transporter [Chloroflexi bacterium]|nr:MFS transporter [Chloroflexota bacterium]
MVLAAFNLRLAIADVPPLLDRIQLDFGLSAALAGVLTGLPVLCFGAFALATPRLTRGRSPELLLVGCLAVVGVGAAVRAGPSLAFLFGGTALLSAAIAIANVVLPGIVKRRFPARLGLVTGLYVMALQVGAAVGAGTAVPIADGADLAWQGALASAAVPAFAAAVFLLVLVGTDRRPVDTENPKIRRIWRDPLAWQVTAFLGLQSLLYQSQLTWIPVILQAGEFTATAAGVLLAIFHLLAVPSSVLIPVLMARRNDQRSAVAVMSGLSASGLLGLLLAPRLAFGWVVILAVAQGGLLGSALTLIVLRSRHSGDATRLSTMAQGVGYLIAACGPALVGVIHQLTGGWELPLLSLVTLVVPMLLTGLRAGRPGYVGNVTGALKEDTLSSG